MKISIIGLGLIGGSIGRATLAKTDHTVYGYDIDELVITKALMMNAINQKGDDKTLAESDLVIIALTPQLTIEKMEEILPKLKKDAILMDCCGTKRVIVDKMRELQDQYPDINFVGVHPMAGREFSGIDHAIVGLFEHAFFIMVPVTQNILALSKLKSYFLSLGAEDVQVSSAEEHDAIISYTSQLAHVVSSSYVKDPLSKVYAGYSAGSFRDLTRVAKLNPDMWTELFIENKDNILRSIDELQKHLSEYREAIANSDEDQLHALLAEGTKMKAEADALLTARKKNV